MASKSGYLISVLLVAALCSIMELVQPGLAQAQQLPPLFPTIPGLFPPGGPPVDISKCWSSLSKVQGCVPEIFNSILSGQFGNIGATCCKQLLAVDANCFPKMFPFNPFSPPLLKDGCSRKVSGSPKRTTEGEN